VEGEVAVVMSRHSCSSVLLVKGRSGISCREVDEMFAAGQHCCSDPL